VVNFSLFEEKRKKTLNNDFEIKISSPEEFVDLEDESLDKLADLLLNKNY
jgi:hypothetical protein